MGASAQREVRSGPYPSPRTPHLQRLENNMLNSIIVAGIRFYRKHLSHRKGYRCAYGAATGRSTCSTVGLRAFRRAGAWRGLLLLNRQFDRCALASESLRETRGSARDDGPYVRLVRPVGPRAAQAGFVDCGGCDAPSCDIPTCDMPSCEVPTCDTRTCHAGRGLNTGNCLLEACSDCSPACDCSPSRDCGMNRSAAAIRGREEERQRKREERRQTAREEDQEDVPDESAQD